MYWWYLSFFILGLESRGLRGRESWLKLKEVGREEEQLGLRGRAVCKDKIPTFPKTVSEHTVAPVPDFTKISHHFMMSDSIYPMSILNSYMKCTNALQISGWQHVLFRHTAMLLVCACVNPRGKYWAHPEVQIDSNECRAALSGALCLWKQETGHRPLTNLFHSLSSWEYHNKHVPYRYS